MKRILFSVLFVTTVAASYTQVYIEDYTYLTVKSGNKHYTDYGTFFTAICFDGSWSDYFTDNMASLGSRLYIHYVPTLCAIGSHVHVSAASYFNVDGWQTNCLNFYDYWAKYRVGLSYMPSHLRYSGGGISIKFTGASIGKNLFANVVGLEYAYLAKNGGLNTHTVIGDLFIREGLFRDCTNLKYVIFGYAFDYMEQDIFLGCKKLEVIQFDEITDPNNMTTIFNTNWDNTGSWYYPDLKAIVVPDNYKEKFPNFDSDFANKVCRAVAEGYCKIITASEFNRKRVKGITLSQSKITIKN